MVELPTLLMRRRGVQAHLDLGKCHVLKTSPKRLDLQPPHGLDPVTRLDHGKHEVRKFRTSSTRCFGRSQLTPSIRIACNRKREREREGDQTSTI